MDLDTVLVTLAGLVGFVVVVATVILIGYGLYLVFRPTPGAANALIEDNTGQTPYR